MLIPDVMSKWSVIIDGVHYVIYGLSLVDANQQSYRSELSGKWSDGPCVVYL